MTNSVQSAYEAAYGAVAVAQLDYGWLRLTGRDRLELLHRLSTNDLRALSPGSGRPTVLTGPTARIIALLFVYATVEAVYLRTAPGQADTVRRYLDSMIFFQDEVSLVDLSKSVAHIGLYGPQSRALLRTHLGVEGALPQEAYAWAETSFGPGAGWLQRGGALDLADWTLTMPQEQASALEAKLAAAAPALDGATLDVLRIEAGLPTWGRELNDQTTPLETGLGVAVSYSKGCYTGQEVIARQTNFDKITRQLAGLRLPRGRPEAPDLNGAAVRAGGGRSGFVGSAAYSPRLDEVIALAVLPRDLAVPGTIVSIGQGAEAFSATVTSLPFIEREAQQW